MLRVKRMAGKGLALLLTVTMLTGVCFSTPLSVNSLVKEEPENVVYGDNAIQQNDEGSKQENTETKTETEKKSEKTKKLLPSGGRHEPGTALRKQGGVDYYMTLKKHVDKFLCVV